MSDNIKLIIEINPNIIYAIQNNKGVTLGNQIDMCNAIKNGIPLDSVKAEIQEKSVWYRGQTYDGLCIALKIIDKYIGKAESEVEPNEADS